MKLCVLILLLAQAGGEVTLSGRITDAVTHQPIAGAEITYCCAHYATATSDINGAWSFHVVPDDEGGTLTVAKSGYAFGQASIPARPGVSQTHDFDLTPAAHISGHIVDRDTNKPLAGFVVSAQSQHRMSNARPSNDDGSFAIVAALPPGDYTMQIDPPARGAKFDEPGYARTWYPGANRIEMASPITLSAGENRDIEVRLQKRPLYHISGVIEAPEGREKDAISISVVAGMRPLMEERLTGAGPFRIDGLGEGPFVLFAIATGTGYSLTFATRAIEITDHSIDNLTLTMRPGISARAAIAMTEDNVKLPEGVEFQPVPVLVGPRPPMIESLDHLALKHLRPGEYWPDLMVPPGYAVTAVSFDGRPVVNSPVDLEALESVVNFVVTSRPAGVTGIVRDTNQKPVPEANVTLIPEIGRQRLSAKSDANGAFHFRDLAPGKYRVLVRDDPADPVVLDFGQIANLELHVK